MKGNFFFIVRVVFLLFLYFFNVSYISFGNTDKNSFIKVLVNEPNENNPCIKKTIKKLSNLAQKIEKTKRFYYRPSIAYWESELKKTFLRYLHSEGYYNAVIETEFLEQKNLIIFHILGWDRYRIKKIFLKHAEDSNTAVLLPSVSSLNLTEGDFIRAINIVECEKALKNVIESNNCLLSLDVSHEAIINTSDKTIDIYFVINAGPQAVIESIDFKGLNSVSYEYVKKLVPLKNKQCFSSFFVKEAEASLQKSGLFALIVPEVFYSHTCNGKAKARVVFNLKEQKYRNIKIGLNHRPDLGMSIFLGWNHKNCFGYGENLKTKVSISKKEKFIDLEFTKNFYSDYSQNYKMGIFQESNIVGGYDNKESIVFLTIEAKPLDMLISSISTKYSYNIIKKTNKNPKEFCFFSLPLFIKYDERSGILNPFQGKEMQFKIEPFFPLEGKGDFFLKNEAILAKYITLESNFNLVLAVKASSGTINGSNSSRMQPNKKFYLGGPESIRGYPYQLAGETDEKGNPIGGYSMFLINLELRTKVKNNTGFVLFWDRGNTFSSAIPKFNGPMFHSFGAGIRYFTELGPLKLDIGFPFRKKREVDKPFQIYLGIGQNF